LPGGSRRAIFRCPGDMRIGAKISRLVLWIGWIRGRPLPWVRYLLDRILMVERKFHEAGGLVTQVTDFFELSPGRIRNLPGHIRL
jgi:hypothetical protein